MNFLIFRNFFEFKINLFNLNRFYNHAGDVIKSGASDRAINHDHRSSLKVGGTWRNLFHWQIIFKKI